VKRLVPKGTSEYQAAWIIEEEEEDEDEEEEVSQPHLGHLTHMVSLRSPHHHHLVCYTSF